MSGYFGLETLTIHLLIHLAVIWCLQPHNSWRLFLLVSTVVLLLAKEPGFIALSFSGDIPAPPGHGAVQPALGDPAWAGGWAG